MSIILSDNIKVQAPKPSDDWRGPYIGNSEAEALAAAVVGVPVGSSGVRYLGRSVDLIIAGIPYIYHWKTGVGDSDLVLYNQFDQLLNTTNSPTFNGSITSNSLCRTSLSGLSSSQQKTVFQSLLTNASSGTNTFNLISTAPTTSTSSTINLLLPTVSGTFALLTDITSIGDLRYQLLEDQRLSTTNNVTFGSIMVSGVDQTSFTKTAGTSGSALLLNTYAPANQANELLNLISTNQVDNSFNSYTIEGVTPATGTGNNDWAIKFQSKSIFVAGLDDIAALSTVYQPLEDQRLSTTNSPTFAGITVSGGTVTTLRKTIGSGAGSGVLIDTYGPNGSVIEVLNLRSTNSYMNEDNYIQYNIIGSTPTPGTGNAAFSIGLQNRSFTLAGLDDITAIFSTNNTFTGTNLFGNGISIQSDIVWANSFTTHLKQGIQTSNINLTLPIITGTLALTSDLSNYASLAGATFTGDIIVKSPSAFKIQDSSGTLQFTVHLGTSNILEILNASGSTVLTLDQSGNLTTTSASDF